MWNDLEEFTPEDLDSIKKAIVGKSISDVSTDLEHNNKVLILHFSDGSKLNIDYDWIYGWSIT
jgi:hypothetical protein